MTTTDLQHREALCMHAEEMFAALRHIRQLASDCHPGECAMHPKGGAVWAMLREASEALAAIKRAESAP